MARLGITLLLTLAAASGCRQLLGIDEERSGQGAGGGVTSDTSSSVGVGDGGAVASSTLQSGSGEGSSQNSTTQSGSSSGGCSGADCPIEVIAHVIGQGSIVAVDGSNVYYSDAAQERVYQCPKTGCAGNPIMLGPGFPKNIVAADGRVFWNDASAAKIAACTIGGCGGEPTSIAGPQPDVHAVASDGTNLFWATDQSIMFCALPSCTTPTLLAQSQGVVRELTADMGIAYWLSPTGDAARSCSVLGCAVPTEVGSGSGRGIAVNAGEVYWVAGNAVAACYSPPCDTPVTIGSSLRPRGLATDDSYVYWRDHIEAKIFRAHHTGGGLLTVIASLQSTFTTSNVAVDAEYIYWATLDKVVRRHK